MTISNTDASSCLSTSDMALLLHIRDARDGWALCSSNPPAPPLQHLVNLGYCQISAAIKPRTGKLTPEVMIGLTPQGTSAVADATSPFADNAAGLRADAVLSQAKKDADPHANTPLVYAPAGSAVAKVYCKGSCRGNPGPGAWGLVFLDEHDRLVRTDAGGETESTNNMICLTAALQATLQAPSDHAVVIVSDSKYVVDGINFWIQKWKTNNWTSITGDIKNRALWEDLDAARASKKIAIEWAKEHPGNRWNEYAAMLSAKWLDERAPMDDVPAPGATRMSAP